MRMPRHFQSHNELEAAAQLAEDAWRSGRWRDAVALYCDAFLHRWDDLDRRSEALTPADLTLLERVTDFAVPLGLTTEADDTLANVAEGYQRLGDRYWHDRIQVKRIHLAVNESRVDQAFDQLGELCGSADLSIQSITDWEAGYPHRPPSAEAFELFAQTWLETGRLMHLQGQNRPALRCFDRGLSQPSTSEACRVHLTLAAARCLLEIGELNAAEQRLTTLRPNLDGARNPGHVTAWHELSGKLHLLRGDFGAAQGDLRDVWKTCRAFAFVVPMVRAATNLAQTLIVLNQTIEARSILKEVFAIASEQGEERLAAQALRLLDVVEARFHGGPERAAGAKDEQAAAERVETPDPALFQPDHLECYTLSHFEDRALGFQLYLRRHDWIHARKSLDRLQPFRSTDSTIVQARLDAMRAMLEYHDGAPALAKEYLSKVRRLFAGLGLKPERWQIQLLLARCLDRLDEDAANRAALGEENDRLLEEFGASLPMPARVTYFLDKATQLDEALAARVRKIQALDARIEQARLFARLRLRFTMWRELNDLLDAAYWQREAHNARLLDRPADSVSIRRGTSLWRRVLWRSPLEATLAFLVLPDSTVGICRRWLSLTFWVSPSGRYEVRRRIGHWHRLIPQSNREERDAVMRSLAETLKLDDLASSLSRYVRRLRILPDDALHGLPFAAVELPGSGRRREFWGDRFSLSIGFQPERRRQHGKAAGDEPLLAGVAGGSPNLRLLVKTPDQIAWVQRWFEARGHVTAPLMDSAATVDAVTTRLETATFFHISCHGEFVQGEPERTGLLLSSDDDHNIVNLLRFSTLDLSKLRHATLIACWAADNFVLPGRWVLSLPEVLWRAGAGSILASLWEVDEDVAERFVKMFYEQLLAHPPDVALQKAQMQMRTTAGKGRDAKDWASFQVYGDPRRLTF